MAANVSIGLMTDFASDIRIQRVIYGKANPQTFLVGQLHGRKTLSNGSKPRAFTRHILLASHVGRSNDQSEALEHRIREREVLQNCLERAAITAMIELHFGKARRVKRRRAFPLRRSNKL